MTESYRGYAEVNGTRLYFEEKGVGPALMLLHGMTLDTRMWDDQFDVFAERFRVVRYDLRGFGRSAVPAEERYTEAEDLMALMGHLGIDRAHVLGLSLGGAVAVDFAVTFPHAVQTLLLADSAVRGFRLITFGTLLSRVNEIAASQGVEAAREHWIHASLFGPAREQPLVAARLEKMMRAYSGWHFVNRDPVKVPKPLAFERLDGIEARTLVLVGERDLPDFRAVADALEHGIRNSTKLVIPGAGHMSNMEAPERFNEAVLHFLEEGTSSSQTFTLSRTGGDAVSPSHAPSPSLKTGTFRRAPAAGNQD